MRGTAEDGDDALEFGGKKRALENGVTASLAVGGGDGWLWRTVSNDGPAGLLVGCLVKWFGVVKEMDFGLWWL